MTDDFIKELSFHVENDNKLKSRLEKTQRAFGERFSVLVEHSLT